MKKVQVIFSHALVLVIFLLKGCENTGREAVRAAEKELAPVAARELDFLGPKTSNPTVHGAIQILREIVSPTEKAFPKLPSLRARSFSTANQGLERLALDPLQPGNLGVQPLRLYDPYGRSIWQELEPESKKKLKIVNGKICVKVSIGPCEFQQDIPIIKGAAVGGAIYGMDKLMPLKTKDQPPSPPAIPSRKEARPYLLRVAGIAWLAQHLGIVSPTEEVSNDPLVSQWQIENPGKYLMAWNPPTSGTPTK